MKKTTISMLMAAIILVVGFHPVSAQITFTIPKIPKIPKIKNEKTQKTRTSTEINTESVQTNDNQSSTDGETQKNETNDSNQVTDAVTQTDDKCTHWWANLVVDELTALQKDIDNYTPQRSWLYNKIPSYNYLLFSVSQRAKQDWLKEDALRIEISKCPNFVAAFDKLNASYTKVLPSLLPDKNGYAFQNAAMNNLMKAKTGDLANHKIFHVGVKQANWLIEKNSFGIPTARYRHGMIWARYTRDDHQYCHAYYINVVQDYAGGGTYGASYANFVKDNIAPCPAGAK
jgi:hypothetical protein